MRSGLRHLKVFGPVNLTIPSWLSALSSFTIEFVERMPLPAVNRQQNPTYTKNPYTLRLG